MAKKTSKKEKEVETNEEDIKQDIESTSLNTKEIEDIKESEEDKRKKAISITNEIKKCINTQFKKEVMISGHTIEEKMKYRYLPTPSLKLNKALNGGFLKGKTAEISGFSDSGKTFLCYQIIAKDMKENPSSIWIWLDTEGDFNPEVCFGLFGVDSDRLLVFNLSEKGAEETLDILIGAINKAGNYLSGFVVNSISALTPQKELENSLEKDTVAQLARLMSKFMRVINGRYKGTDIVGIFINQLRNTIGSYGNPMTTTGGNAMGFFASKRIKMQKVRMDNPSLKEDEYMKVRIKVDKNRGAIGNPQVTLDIYIKYGYGIDDIVEIVDTAVAQNIIEKKGGGNYLYITDSNEEIKLRGYGNLYNYIKDNELIRKEIESKLHLEDTISSQSKEEIEAIMKEEQEFLDKAKDLDKDSFTLD